MAQSVESSSAIIDLQAWDNELAAAGKTVDYEKLYQAMLKASKESAGQSVEIWWRLAKVTFLASLNMDDPVAIKEKTLEVVAHAEKALTLDSSNFQANLWSASAAGKLALLEDNLPEKLK